MTRVNGYADMWHETVKAGRSGIKVHIRSAGSSVTMCGQWSGRSGLYPIDAAPTCKHCINHWPGLAARFIEIYGEQKGNLGVE
jgi:hypothetical protein